MKTDAEVRKYLQGILQTTLRSVANSYRADEVSRVITPVLEKKNFKLNSCQARGSGRYSIVIESADGQRRLSMQIS